MCIAMLQGCFYIKALPEPYVNRPPEIVFPRTEPHVVEVVSPTVTLRLDVREPEDERIFVEWPTLVNVPLNDAALFRAGRLWVATVEIADATLVPGGQVTAYVTDEKGGNVVEVTYELVFP